METQLNLGWSLECLIAKGVHSLGLQKNESTVKVHHEHIPSIEHLQQPGPVLNTG